MNLKKNPFGLLFFAGIVLIMLFTFLEDKQVSAPSPNPSNTGSSVQSTPPPQKATGMIPVGTWPPADTENKISMAADPTATNYYVILDASGSMNKPAGGDRKMDSAKTALKSFVMNLPEEANLGLSTFSPAREIIPLGIGNRAEFLKAVKNIRPKGGTPLVRSIQQGYESLTEQARRQSGYGRYILLIVTDGQSSDGDPSSIAREIVRHSAIEVQTIGFGVENHALNIRGVTDYYTANSVETLVSALQEVLASETETFVDPTSFSQ